ncbi:hypothetical protein MIND_01208500 [Mycena indigotica]|uniref:Uncharacterized protein n=1 Tax=Mycena indigotica TaxID=2126181 RepID=A0A8H6S5A8_9AGAR|nr:uncharacterized protein MIND_01208500 [Mycena indigotica]KAF7293091.1 hypothetical protein MIND_01208500 [Mycena indigotica]
MFPSHKKMTVDLIYAFLFPTMCTNAGNDVQGRRLRPMDYQTELKRKQDRNAKAKAHMARKRAALKSAAPEIQKRVAERTRLYRKRYRKRRRDTLLEGEAKQRSNTEGHWDGAVEYWSRFWPNHPHFPPVMLDYARSSFLLPPPPHLLDPSMLACPIPPFPPQVPLLDFMYPLRPPSLDHLSLALSPTT